MRRTGACQKRYQVDFQNEVRFTSEVGDALDVAMTERHRRVLLDQVQKREDFSHQSFRKGRACEALVFRNVVCIDGVHGLGQLRSKSRGS